MIITAPSASYGLQTGTQSFGYALFFIDNDDLNYLKKSDGWEISVGPSIVIVDEGIARSLATTTAKNGVYAFIFHQKGLKWGASVSRAARSPRLRLANKSEKRMHLSRCRRCHQCSSKGVRPEGFITKKIEYFTGEPDEQGNQPDVVCVDINYLYGNDKLQ